MLLTAYPKIEDVDACENEPIQFIPKIQTHGCAIVFDQEFSILQHSKNLSNFINQKHSSLTERSLSDVLEPTDFIRVQQWVQNPIEYDSFNIKLKTECVAIPHSIDGVYMLDIEPCDENWDPSDFQRRMLSIMNSLTVAGTRTELLDTAARQIKQLIGYDRVMIYQFDKDWNGSIVAEEVSEEAEKWVGLRYPASDIPKKARELYLDQRVRMISNVDDHYSEMVPSINPYTGALLDLSKSHLRGSSPFHIQYLQNMGVGATLSCAIMNNDKLWGLLACHHNTPKFINFQERQSCILLSELLSAQINIKSSNKYFLNIENMTRVRSTLVTQMSKDWNILEGLTSHKTDASDLLPRSSFAISYESELRCVGNYCDQAVIQSIIDAIDVTHPNEDLFISDCLSKDLPDLKINPKDVSGVLLARISRKKNEHLLWLRPEQVQFVNWGGNPNKQVTIKTGNQVLSPRHSFEKWKEKVQCTSLPWEDHEVAAVKSLVEDIRNLIVAKYGEIKQLNKQLVSLNEELESFSYSVSHDLRGPLRGIDGFAQILMEDYGTALDEYGKDSLNIIIKSASKMNDLMDDILGYSGLGKVTKIDDYHNVHDLCLEVIKDNEIKEYYPNTTLSIERDMPKIYGDRAMLYQLFTNLITNAFKYSGKGENPEVRIFSYNDGANDIYAVSDNGIGFKSEYAKKIFGVFTRLVKDEFKGTGVGLAIAQRIVLRHHGQVWAESKLGEGATFKFYLQANKKL
ncbi:MAG: ATP-binding protein [Nonlabens sp.]